MKCQHGLFYGLTPTIQTTIYRYDAVGNLTNVDYANSPDLSFAYDANNRLTNMVDAAGTTRYTYTSFGAVASEDGPWADDTVTYAYANQLRSGMSLQQPSALALSTTYAYDSNGRLTTIAGGAAGTFNYGYDPSMKLNVNRIGLPNGAYITNTFDTMGQVTGTYLKNGSGTILNSHVYTYDPFNFKDLSRQTRTDGSYVDYAYDGIGQLKSALGKEAGGSSRLNESFRYVYDHAGNLSHRTNDILDESFSVDTWDKLVNVTRSGRITVAGTTSAAATNVTVNTSNAFLYADNTFASTNHSLTATGFTAVAKDSYGRRDTNAVSNVSDSVSLGYDDDGRLVNDGRLGFQYDEQNQLIAVWDDVVASWKSEFVYDGKMRRRIRKEFTWTGSAWQLTNEVRYIYDGNLVVQERDALNAPAVTYTRGSDLSGSFEGAGGIGGLLARRDERARSTAFYHADRLGNVTMLVNAQQIPVAKYSYDPFGNTLAWSGPLADVNLYRFSSKEIDQDAGVLHYLYRFYQPGLQRWITRDPLGDSSFGPRKQRPTASQYSSLLATYTFVQNRPCNWVDPDGLSPFSDCMAECDKNFKRDLRSSCKVAGQLGTLAAIFGGVVGAIAGAEMPQTSVGTAVIFGGGAGVLVYVPTLAFLTTVSLGDYDLCSNGCIGAHSKYYNDPIVILF
jgi:RHS repeat-associated protein